MTSISEVTKHCKRCDRHLSLSRFSKDKHKKDGLCSICKECASDSTRAWKASDPQRYKESVSRYRRTDKYKKALRRRELKKLYGISVEQFARMSAAQEHRCGICGADESSWGEADKLFVDHDHDSEAIRGLLCRLCNLGLGAFRDDPERLRAAATYLERAAAREASA